MPLNSSNLICLVAGQSAGHILPALTIAAQLKRADPAAKILFFSNASALDLKLLANNALVDQHVPLQLPQIPYRAPWRLPIFVWQLFKTVWQVRKILKSARPLQTISTGGLVSVPVGLMSWWLKIPLTLYELNVHPGKAVKFLARFAVQIKVCFPQTVHDLPKGKSVLVDYPIRFTKVDYQLSPVQAWQMLPVGQSGLVPTRKTILILGGSQGSRSLNELVMGYINGLPANSQVQIIHQTGAQSCELLLKFYQLKSVPALVFSYQENLMPYLVVADLIICRAGAGTLAEVLPLNKPVIVIPLQTSYTSHQLENGQALAQLHPQLNLLVQSEIEATPQTLYERISLLLV